jgi:hypothetical protein
MDVWRIVHAMICFSFLRSRAQKTKNKKKKNTALPKAYDLADCISRIRNDLKRGVGGAPELSASYYPSVARGW